MTPLQMHRVAVCASSRQEAVVPGRIPAKSYTMTRGLICVWGFASHLGAAATNESSSLPVVSPDSSKQPGGLSSALCEFSPSQVDPRCLRQGDSAGSSNTRPSHCCAPPALSLRRRNCRHCHHCHFLGLVDAADLAKFAKLSTPATTCTIVVLNVLAIPAPQFATFVVSSTAEPHKAPDASASDWSCQPSHDRSSHLACHCRRSREFCLQR